MALAEDLTSLSDLFERGVIDQQHFEEAKARLLGDGGEVSTEGVGEDEGSLPPTPDSTHGVKTPVVPPSAPSPDVPEHPECAEPDEDPEVEDPQEETLRERLVATMKRQHPVFFVAIALAVAGVVTIGGLVYADANAPMSQVEARNTDAAGFRYPSDNSRQRVFIDSMRQRFDDVDDMSGVELLEWGYEHCGWLNYWQPSSFENYMLLTSQFTFDDEQHKERFLGIVYSAGNTICDEYSYIWDWMGSDG